MVIIIILKSNSRVDSGQNPGQWLRLGSQVKFTRVSVKIKIIIIIILKLDSTIDPGQDLSHE